MRSIIGLSACIVALLVAGCATSAPIALKDKATVVMLDKASRTPSSKVELLRRRPFDQFSVIGLITYKASPEDEAQVTAAFIEIAQERGADAIVFVAGGELSLLGAGNRIVFANAAFNKSFSEGVAAGAARSSAEMQRMAERAEDKMIVFKAEMLVYQKGGI